MLFVVARTFLISRIDRLIYGTVRILSLNIRLKFNHSMNLIRLVASTRPSNKNYLHSSTKQLKITINKFQHSKKKSQTNSNREIYKNSCDFIITL